MNQNILLNKFSNNKIIIHISTWVLFFLIFFFGINRFETAPTAFLFMLGIFIPGVLSVYFHFFLLEKYFSQKRYILYIILLLSSIIIFGLLTEFLFEEVIFAKEKNVHIAGILTIALFILVSTGFSHISKNIKQKIKLKEAEAKQAQAELALLKSQVNPHFLFNSLNNIYSLILDDPQVAGEVVLKLSSLMRYLIECSSKTEVSLKEECNFIRNFIDMEKLRLGEKCNLNFRVQGNINGVLISPFLLIPFVENSFKHGSFATIRESYIDILLEVNQNKLVFSIDNSINKSIKKLEFESTETGINNVKKRLNILFPDKHKLSIKKYAQNFLVNLEIALT